MAFVARDQQQKSNYQNGDRLVYKIADLNPGGHYNSATGEYSCSASGLYYFTYSIYASKIEDGHSISRATIRLMKESVEQGNVFIVNENSEAIFTTLSQSVLIQCKAGEKVWVEAGADNTNIGSGPGPNVFVGIALYINWFNDFFVCFIVFFY